MVIAIHTSDSTNTLVSLDNNHRSKEAVVNLSSSSCSGSTCRRSSSSSDLRKTALLLPVEDLPGLDSSSSTSLDSSDDSYGSCRSCDHHHEQQQQASLYLPSSASCSMSVDEVLQHVPSIRESRDELLSLDHHRFTEASPEQVVYVLQGEVAHALPSQCDFLVSDRATTCHIMALRSTATTMDSQQAMTTLTHIDGVQYESSVRAMVQEHKNYHHASSSTAMIEMDITVLGGFSDVEGHSQEISNWLLRLLADIADEEQQQLQMRLKTCAITSMNDNGFACPLGRGLAIHLATGHTFLAQADGPVTGPHMALRNARLWSERGEKNQTPELSLIHSIRSNDLVIQPFAFPAIPGMETLLTLKDDMLLQYTSTSPTVEEDDFCHSIRTTLHFLREVSCASIFGPHTDQTLRFERQSVNTNNWVLTTRTE